MPKHVCLSVCLYVCMSLNQRQESSVPKAEESSFHLFSKRKAKQTWTVIAQDASPSRPVSHGYSSKLFESQSPQDSPLFAELTEIPAKSVDGGSSAERSSAHWPCGFLLCFEHNETDTVEMESHARTAQRDNGQQSDLRRPYRCIARN